MKRVRGERAPDYARAPYSKLKICPVFGREQLQGNRQSREEVMNKNLYLLMPVPKNNIFVNHTH